MAPSTSASGGAAAAPTSKRKLSHVSRACAGCRRRRSRCDGAQPICGSCAQTEETCTYGTDHDGRKAASKSYVDALERRCKILEDLLEAAGLSHGGGGDVEEPMSKGKEKAQEDGQGQGSDNEAVQAIEMLKIDDDTGELRQYGPHSLFAHLPGPLPTASSASPEPYPGLSSSVGTDTFSPSSSSLRDDGGLWPAAPPTPGSVDWSRHLPTDSIPALDEQLHDHLLDLFFNYFDPWCGWTSGAAGSALFRRDMATCLSSPSAPERTSYYSPMLHNAILALAVVYCSDPRVKDVPADIFFASVAKDAIEGEVERPMLSTLQGLMVLGSVHSGLGRQGQGYYFAGAGLRMSTTLGLGIDSSPWVRKGLVSQETKEERERTFWFAFIQDKLWASHVGRPPTITCAHYQTRLPTVFKAKDDQLWQSRLEDCLSHPSEDGVDSPKVVSIPSYASTTFLWTAKLAILAEKISESIYTLKVDLRSPRTRAVASELHLQLEAWYDQLPPAIMISPHSNKPHPTHVIMLHLMHWHFSCLLHRPFFPRKRGEPSTPTSELAVKSCEKAAAKLFQLLQLHRTCAGLRYATISLTQITFTTGRIHLLLAVNGDRGSKKVAAALANARTCVEMLDEMPWVCAKATARNLDGLINDWNPVAIALPPPKDPLLHLDAQALNPHSALTKQLKALGWTPPVPPPSQQQPQPEQIQQQQPNVPPQEEGSAYSLAAKSQLHTTQYDPSAPMPSHQQQQPYYPFASLPPPHFSLPTASTSLPTASTSLPTASTFNPFTTYASPWPFSHASSQQQQQHHLPVSHSPTLAAPFAAMGEDASMLALFESQAAFGMPVAGGWAAAGYGGGQWDAGFGGWGEGGAS